jgi:hypothetical protein
MSQNLINYIYQAGISFIIFGLLARWYVVPFLRRLSLYDTLQILFIPFLFRQVGATLLAPTVVPIPSSQAYAWGVTLQDLYCLLAALVAIIALRRRSPFAVPLCWFVAISALLLFLVMGTWALFDKAADHLYAHWYVSCYFVPLLGVLKVLIIYTLLTRGKEAAQARPA